MPRFPRHLLRLALALVALIALAAPSTAAADVADKIHQRLQQQVSSQTPEATHAVLVVGTNPAGALTAHGTMERDLSFVGAASGTIPGSALDALAARDDVAFVAPDVSVEPSDDGNDRDGPRLGALYPLIDRAHRAWEQGLDGSGVGIAVIDSGVSDSPNFGSRLEHVPLPAQSGSLDDAHGHGTMVAGIAAGKSADRRFVGIAPGAKIFALKVDDGAGVVRTSDVIAALQWVFDNAHAHNIRVVNLSLAESLAGSYQQSTLDLAVERLWASGIVVVVAAGNLGSGLVDVAPANDPLAITVGSTDTNGTRAILDDTVATFSSSGLTLDGHVKPELVAPGRLVASVLPPGSILDLDAPAANRVAPGFATISGTSFSAPQVAGAAAILFQQHPNWSPDNVKWVLMRKAREIVGSTAGTLNVAGAVDFGRHVGRANQGVAALVCAPGSTCLVAGTIGTVSSSWNSSSWNSSSWNSSSWNSSSWNSSSWNSSSWNSSSWNSSSWNSSSWNSSSWNSSSWNSSSWN